ncbi:TPA: GGDEF domain-containing protein [Photobacterium damselae]
MGTLSQLSTRLISIVCLSILIAAFFISNGTLSVVTSILTLVLIIMLLLEDFGKAMKLPLILALILYGFGVAIEILNQVPELREHPILKNTDTVFVHLGVFMICFCLIKLLHQRHSLIKKLNIQINKAKQLEGELSKQALQDDLTLLGNRRALFRRFDQLVLKHEKGMLAYIDIDNFKQVNDMMGHKSGDHVLVQIAKILVKTAPIGSHYYRIGGDEFVVLFPTDDEKHIRDWIDTLYQQTEELCQYYSINLSMGLAPYHQGNLSDPDSILVQADSAMYLDKSKKKISMR